MRIEHLVIVFRRSSGLRGGGSVTITCEKCGTHAQFRKKHTREILLFVRDHLHSR